MSTLKQRIKAFSELGLLFDDFLKNNDKSEYKNWVNSLKTTVSNAYKFNNWFEKKNILLSLESWKNELNEKNITDWTSKYQIDDYSNKTVAIIMAGNIPLVGFHDFLCASLLNFNCIIKMSSDDKILFPFIIKFLNHIIPGFEKKNKLTEKKLTDFDAVIATGSDSSFKYFNYYFEKYPSILRKNRHSIAVLNGKESNNELDLLSNDIFQYFGMGCRSVSKIFVPKEYSFDPLFKSFFKYKYVMNNNRYMNNYDYNKAVFLMSNFKFVENGFKILKEDKKLGSPIACLFYENYNNIEEIKNYIKTNSQNLQCIVTNISLKNKVDFGSTQKPKLNDYADNIDTVKFLLKI